MNNCGDLVEESNGICNNDNIKENNVCNEIQIFTLPGNSEHRILDSKNNSFPFNENVHRLSVLQTDGIYI